MKIAQVTLLQQTYFNPLRQVENPWAIQRRVTSTFVLRIKPTQQSWEELAEEAFHITNAPEELLSEYQQCWLKFHHRTNLRAPSLSVGDVVQVTHEFNTEFYLCRSSGWEVGYDEKLVALFNNLVAESNLPPDWNGIPDWIDWI
jgi:hypothetical protein